MATMSLEITQGYLSRDPERTVRVRKCGGRAYLTIKSKNEGAARLEFEYEIPSEDFDELIRLALPPVISKTRHLVDYEGYLWEVDEFHGHLAPLTVAEIELPDPDTPFSRPPFVGEDVTGNPKYYNSNL